LYCFDTLKSKSSQDLFNDWSDRNKMSQSLQESTKTRSTLPIYAMKTEIMEAIHNNPVVLIRGNTGCGKTTQVNLQL
jgi:HrpA-like RNA helicase